MAPSHTDKAFERDLSDLREKLLAMSARVERQISDSVQSLVDRDSKLAENVIHADAEVNRLEVERAVRSLPSLLTAARSVSMMFL